MGALVIVQPNPASEYVSFMLVGGEAPLRVEIWDAAGPNSPLHGDTQVIWRIPGELPEGLYFWRAESTDYHRTGRLLIWR